MKGVQIGGQSKAELLGTIATGALSSCSTIALGHCVTQQVSDREVRECVPSARFESNLETRVQSFASHSGLLR